MTPHTSWVRLPQPALAEGSRATMDDFVYEADRNVKAMQKARAVLLAEGGK